MMARKENVLFFLLLFVSSFTTSAIAQNPPENIPKKNILDDPRFKEFTLKDVLKIKDGFVTLKFDPNIVKNEKDYDEDKTYLSPPRLGFPIYACSTNVTVTSYIHKAEIDVEVNGNVIHTQAVSHPSVGTNIDLGAAFTDGQQVRVRQRFGGQTSDWSNVVPVTSHLKDYPNGLPRPRVWNKTLRKCGRALLATDVVPGATISVFAQTHGTTQHREIGSFKGSTKFGLNWTTVNPEFATNSNVTLRAKLCTSESDRSLAKVPQTGPDPVPDAALETPVVEGTDSVTVIGSSSGTFAENGAVIRIEDRGNHVGGGATPGEIGHIFHVNPSATTSSRYKVTQKLCATSPGQVPPIEPVPCSQMPAPAISPPLPGDRTVRVTRHVPGARLLVFANNEEVGDSGGNVIVLKRPLAKGETVRVIQRLGNCEAAYIYSIKTQCHLGEDEMACSKDWPAFRHSGLRNAQQANRSALSDPYKVKTLEVKKRATAPDGGNFRGSPVVHKGFLYIGSSRGHLYAFDAQTLQVKWQYPPRDEPALLSDYQSNPSSFGIAASVAMAKIENEDVVILGAPDKGRSNDPGGKFGSGLGSGRLFALDAQTGRLVWKSKEEIAVLSGTTPNALNEKHEQIGYSAPLVLNGRIYVGIGDHADNPIQKGKVIAVDLNSGNIIKPFKFEAANDADNTHNRGGGVWTYVSGGISKGVFTTTGNTKNRHSRREATTNHGLSMVRLDPENGALQGKLQPVPWAKDDDPDWAAGASLVRAACGETVVSTMKDGYSYAASAGNPLTLRWQFPPVGYPFPSNDPKDHGDIRFHRAGALWNDTYITMTGGANIVSDKLPAEKWAGYRRLHALNICSGHNNRVRWIADLKQPYTRNIPANENEARHFWGLGPPTVTHGIVYVGTQQGWLVALADPSVWPGQESICSYDGIDYEDCEANNLRLISRPTVLKAINLQSGHILRTEPVLSGDNVYVATEAGVLFRIAPK